MPANWYSPWQPQPGDLYVERPNQLGNGSASLLPMSDSELEALKRKPKRTLGFAALSQPAHATESDVIEPPMWELG